MKTNQIFKTFLLIGGLLLSVAACDQAADSKAEKPAVEAGTEQQVASESMQVSVTILAFNEVETGIDPYTTRMLISERYIRIDDGAESDGFVLFDRLKKRIFSVVDDNESILVVDPIIALQDVPAGLNISSELMDTEDVPTIAGVKPVYYQFRANGTLCYHVITAKGFLPEVTSALQSYQTVLAAQQQETVDATPAELQTPCFLANYIYAPTRYIAKGFPIEQWDTSGYRRSLIGVEEEAMIDKAVFELPDGYEYFSIGSGNIKM